MRGEGLRAEPFVLRGVLKWVGQNWGIELGRSGSDSWERALANSVFSLKFSVPIMYIDI